MYFLFDNKKLLWADVINNDTLHDDMGVFSTDGSGEIFEKEWWFLNSRLPNAVYKAKV